jgi:sulfur transfer complex TusBCD TusB component (DsrH family)
LLDKHHVTYEWIIREELTWGAGSPVAPSGQEAGTPVEPQASVAGQEVTSLHGAPVAPERRAELSATERPSPSAVTFSEASEATILHILRRLRDESAWQIIRTQHDMQPVAVLLMHDAVLAPPPLEVPMYACEADVMARGITSPLPRLTYDQIVDLIFACQRVMVW